MTAEQLILQLSQVPGDTPVVVCSPGGKPWGIWEKTGDQEEA